jgi:acyl dehydratase
MISCNSVSAIQALAGAAPECSGYIVIDQQTINAFARLTRDEQWIHVDVERAERESAFGSTIAHGFLTLSLVSGFFTECFSFPGRKMAVNYGFDRLRFITPVKAGARVRGCFSLDEAIARGDQEAQCTWDVRIDIEGQEKPALAAKWITRAMY